MALTTETDVRRDLRAARNAAPRPSDLRRLLTVALRMTGDDPDPTEAVDDAFAYINLALGSVTLDGLNGALATLGAALATLPVTGTGVPDQTGVRNRLRSLMAAATAPDQLMIRDRCELFLRTSLLRDLRDTQPIEVEVAAARAVLVGSPAPTVAQAVAALEVIDRWRSRTPGVVP